MTLLEQLSRRIGQRTDVEWTLAGELVGFTATILDVREAEPEPTEIETAPRAIQIDTDDGYRFVINETTDQPVTIKDEHGNLIRDEFHELREPPPISQDLADAVFPIVTGDPPIAVTWTAPTTASQVYPPWFVENPPDDFTPGGPDDPWKDEPLWSSIMGTAGTGKTFNQKLRSDVDPRVKLTATTGIAAINLGGQTINSLLHYKDTNELATQFELGRLNGALGRLADSGFTRLIIDEVSMMDGRQLDILCEAIDRLNERLQGQGDPLMGITLVGDFCQLPPVKAPFVFERSSWARFTPASVRLTEPRRQADPDFVHALQAVRRGDTVRALDYFGTKIKNTIDQEFLGSTIMATNKEVDRHNSLKLMELPGREIVFTAHRTGLQAAEWRNIPDTNKLKIGALVMILANRREKPSGRGNPDDEPDRKMIHANGDLGVLEDVVGSVATPTGANGDTALVRLHRTGQVVSVPPVLREYKKATGSKGQKAPREETEGSIVFMPLRIAYATTCHKSQGLSLDRVQIVMNNPFFGNPGMLYVALSRSRTPEGLRLVGSGAAQFKNRISVDPKVIPWL